MRKRFFALCLLIFAGLFLKANDQINAVIYDGTGTSLENRHIAMTLAGIVNRDAPRLYLLNVYETWSYNQTDEFWRDLYQEQGGANFTVISDIVELVNHFSDFINGAITYNPSVTYGNFSGQSFRWQAEVASMIGGLTDCIPLPFNNTTITVERPDSVVVPDFFHGEPDIKISAKLELSDHPWNNVFLSQGQRYMLILDWALETLLERTNPRMFYLREVTDWAVNQRMFQMNLAGTESLNFYSLPDEKAEKIEQAMQYMLDNHPDDVFHVYGWMRPEPLVQWISGWGGSFHETLLSNLSWHRVFPVEDNYVYERPSDVDPESLVLEDKHYVLFIGSEGDAGNWNLGFQAGAWHSAARGEVPVGWGFNLHMFEMFPFVARYYFETATENDGFISVINPLGYAYADMFPENILPDAISQSAYLLHKFSVPSVYAYKHYNGAGVSTYRGIVISNNYNFGKLGSFSEASGAELTFLFDPGLQTQQYYTQYGGLLYNHVNDNTFYGNATDLNAVSQRIINRLSAQSTPSFYLAGYQRFRQDGTSVGANNPADMTLPRLKTVMDNVKANAEIGDKVQFVTPEQFTYLLQKKILTTSVSSIIQNPNSFRAFVTNHNELNVYLEDQDPGSYNLRVFDMAGREIKSFVWQYSGIKQSERFGVNGLSRGIYIVSIQGSSFASSVKVIL